MQQWHYATLEAVALPASITLNMRKGCESVIHHWELLLAIC